MFLLVRFNHYNYDAFTHFSRSAKQKGYNPVYTNFECDLLSYPPVSVKKYINPCVALVSLKGRKSVRYHGFSNEWQIMYDLLKLLYFTKKIVGFRKTDVLQRKGDDPIRITF